MTLAVFSDSHGSVSEMLDVLNKRKADLIIHLGDTERDANIVASQMYIPLISVAGNCDFFPTAPYTVVTEINGINIFICHGNEFGGEEAEVAEAAKQNNCSLAFFGHTHIPIDTVIGGVRVINPGSIHKPRHPSPCKTYAFGDISDGKAKINIMEYGF